MKDIEIILIDDGSTDRSSQICDEDKSNQLFFADKEEINEGVKRFMADFVDIYGRRIMDEISPQFIDSLYGCLMSENVKICSSVKRSFFCDNGMFHDMDNPVFA